MKTSDNQYERKAQYNPNRQTYVDENGNYVYLIWDEEAQDYRREVCVVGDGGISPELRTMLDEIEKQPLVLENWEERLWISLLESATVHADNRITFRFKDGTEIDVASE